MPRPVWISGNELATICVSRIARNIPKAMAKNPTQVLMPGGVGRPIMLGAPADRRTPYAVPANAGTHVGSRLRIHLVVARLCLVRRQCGGAIDPGLRGCHPIGLPRERLRKSGEFFDFRGKMPGKDPACGNEWLFPYARGSREKTDTQYRFPERELGDSLLRRSAIMTASNTHSPRRAAKTLSSIRMRRSISTKLTAENDAAIATAPKASGSTAISAI